MDDRPLLTGAALKKFVLEERTTLVPIAENFIYRKSIIMLSGDPGVGKSTINANIIRDLSVGAPVFNFFHTTKPIMCYYIPFERGAYEIAERLQDLSKVIEPNWDNIVIKPDFIGFDIGNDKQHTHFTSEVIKDLKYLGCAERDIFLMTDPIISMVSGEIKEEKHAKAITRACNTIQTASDCAMMLTNHTIKAALKVKDKTRIDPFYGSQTFKAFCTLGIYVYANKAKGGIHMQCTKSSHGNSIDNIHLNFDDFTYSLFAKADDSGIKSHDKVLAAIRAIRITGVKRFTFNNIKHHQFCEHVGKSTIKRVILHDEPFKSGLKALTAKGSSTVLEFNNNWV